MNAAFGRGPLPHNAEGLSGPKGALSFAYGRAARANELDERLWASGCRGKIGIFL